jgi:hypothetical protein
MHPVESHNLPLLALLPLPVYFAAIWCLSSYAVSWFSGWHALISSFRATSEPYGDVLTAGPFFYTVYFRWWCHYGSAIRMTAADDALYLSVIFLIRIGHPTLRIPWDEIKFSRDSWLFMKSCVRVTIGREEQIPMYISDRMARNLGILNRLETQSPAPVLLTER